MEIFETVGEYGLSITLCVVLGYSIWQIYKYQREDTQAIKNEYLARQEKLLSTQTKFAESLNMISDTLNLQREELKSLKDEVRELKERGV